MFGGILAVTGLLGTACGGAIADRVGGQDRTRAALKLCAFSSAVAVPLALVAILAPSELNPKVFPWLVVGALAVCELTIFLSVSPTNAAILQSVEARDIVERGWIGG